MAELLQVVLSILSWIVGLTFFGAVITIAVNLARDYRQRKRELQREEDQRRRERTGLLTLLDLETDQNDRQLTAYEQDSTWIVRAPDHTLSIRMWEATMVRLSQLLEEEEDFADLLKYYESIFQINGFRQNGDESAVLRQRTVMQGLPQLREQSNKAMAVIRKYVPEEALQGTPLKDITFDRDPERWGKRTG
jgi:hypothetical protein